ncbi:MAG TPA: tetratricopeptide repeat protein [Pseudobdellovibrionaceae bacterium]|nr:tetratricopeptide repeat protein [Pseudobdellovibrionaceae bacterium]
MAAGMTPNNQGQNQIAGEGQATAGGGSVIRVQVQRASVEHADESALGIDGRAANERGISAWPMEHREQAVAQFDAEADEETRVNSASGAVAAMDGGARVPGWLKQAALLARHGEYGASEAILRQVLWADSQNREGIEAMGNVLEQQGRFDESLRVFRALLRQSAEMTPGGVDPRLHVARLLYKLEEDQSALALYSEILSSAIPAEDQLFETYKNVGNILCRQGDFEGAEEFYNKAHVLQPKSDVLLVNFGTLEIQRDRLDLAKERFRAALEENPHNDRAWVGLALIHRHKGDFELSWGNLERALDLAPHNRTALRLMVEWAVRDGRLGSAIARLEAHISVNQEDTELIFQLVKALALVGRFAEALLECERVVAMDPAMQDAIRLRRELAERVEEDRVADVTRHAAAFGSENSQNSKSQNSATSRLMETNF